MPKLIPKSITLLFLALLAVTIPAPQEAARRYPRQAVPLRSPQSQLGKLQADLAKEDEWKKLCREAQSQTDHNAVLTKLSPLLIARETYKKQLDDVSVTSGSPEYALLSDLRSILDTIIRAVLSARGISDKKACEYLQEGVLAETRAIKEYHAERRERRLKESSWH